MKKNISHFFLACFIISILAACQHDPRQKENTLVIFHAGSLTLPVKQISDAFIKENPEIRILSEASGSVASARKITDLNRSCDLFLSADYSIIDKFLIPKYSSWNIKFASNEMVLAYTEKSNLAQKINQNNWTEILLEDKIKFGRSDPNSDPCGYRTVLCTELTEKVQHAPGLSLSILSKDQRYIRPKETDLIALLETRTLDYIFIYRSVAVQHKLKYVVLPDSINLKDPKLEHWYQNAVVEIAGKKPGETIKQSGEPMVYGLTIPKDAPNPALAKRFASFFLNRNQGMKIMEKCGQPSVIPSFTNSWDYIPKPLQVFAISEPTE